MRPSDRSLCLLAALVLAGGGMLTASALGGTSSGSLTPTALKALSGATHPSGGSVVAAGSGTGHVTWTACAWCAARAQ